MEVPKSDCREECKAKFEAVPEAVPETVPDAVPATTPEAALWPVIGREFAHAGRAGVAGPAVASTTTVPWNRVPGSSPALPGPAVAGPATSATAKDRDNTFPEGSDGMATDAAVATAAGWTRGAEAGTEAGNGIGAVIGLRIGLGIGIGIELTELASGLPPAKEDCAPAALSVPRRLCAILPAFAASIGVSAGLPAAEATKMGGTRGLGGRAAREIFAGGCLEGIPTWADAEAEAGAGSEGGPNAGPEAPDGAAELPGSPSATRGVKAA